MAMRKAADLYPGKSKADVLIELAEPHPGEPWGGAGSRRLGSVLMGNEENVPRVLSGLAVPPSGSLEATGSPFEPYRLADCAGETIRPAAAFFAELVACGWPLKLRGCRDQALDPRTSQ